jgi:NAD-dependent deacetylase
LEFDPEFIKKLIQAKSVCVLTGAGVSKESGVPTFRDADGLWKKFKSEELASMDAFMRNPELVWEWYLMRRKVVRDVKPNAGHEALVQLEALFSDFTLVTQNVDDLHRRAGSRNVLELHGNIERSFCMKCGKFGSGETDIVERPDGKNILPKCPHCGGLFRPDVVWFGEILPEEIFSDAVKASEDCEVFLSIGTSGAVFPAAGLPLLAKEAGAYVVEINPEYTELSDRMDATYLGPSGSVLPALLEVLEGAKNAI